MTAVQAVGPAEELPPCTRRIPYFGRRNWKKLGTTSAHAENTLPPVGAGTPAGNYLRARGEYHFHRFSKEILMELPPRARRIQLAKWADDEVVGTTSACAENTRVVGCPPGELRNYLRVRGEYVASCRSLVPARELPPRARRILFSQIVASEIPGTTSACAENTGVMLSRIFGWWNYLRVRGEYANSNSILS